MPLSVPLCFTERLWLSLGLIVEAARIWVGRSGGSRGVRGGGEAPGAAAWVRCPKRRLGRSVGAHRGRCPWRRRRVCTGDSGACVSVCPGACGGERPRAGARAVAGGTARGGGGVSERAAAGRSRVCPGACGGERPRAGARAVPGAVPPRAAGWCSWPRRRRAAAGGERPSPAQRSAAQRRREEAAESGGRERRRRAVVRALSSV